MSDKFELSDDFFEEIEINYNPDDFDDSDIAEAMEEIRRYQAERVFHDDYLRFMSNFSYNNEIPCEILFFCHLSLVTKDLPITFNGKPVQMKIHFNWQQDSSTGKGEAFREYIRTTNEYSKITDKPIVISQLDGSESTASYYNDFQQVKGKYKFDLAAYPYHLGVFERSDLIVVEECSYFFVEKRGQQQTKAEVMLKALDDEPIEKTLKCWENRATITIPNFQLLTETRKIEEVQGTLAQSGFLQRQIPFFRNVTSEESDQMIERDFASMDIGEERVKQLELERRRIAKKLLDIRIWMKMHNTFSFENEKEAFAIIGKTSRDIKKKIFDTLYASEHKEIAESFRRRMPKKMMTFFILNAAMKKRNKITRVDVLEITKLFNKIFDALLLWIEQSIDENRFQKQRRMFLFNQIKRWKAEGKTTVEFDALVSIMTNKTGYSEKYCRELIRKYSEGEKSFFIVDKGKQLVTLR